VPHLLVIGGASLDVLHVGDRIVPSPGGAGVYTAMAARRCGVKASLFAPRPAPMPAELRAVDERLSAWLGPSVRPDELPRFEISHDGGRTTYLDAFFGAEQALAPSSLPHDLCGYDIVHVVPLGDVRRQRDFVRACRRRGAKVVSAGTYLRGVDSSGGDVRSIVQEADIVFMNRSEAEGLFGSLEAAETGAGKLLVVTLGPRGARVIQGRHATDIPSAAADELDPTGAGDTFCGATLAGLIRHEHPVMAARAAAPLAAAVVEHVGPTALVFEGPPPAPSEEAAAVDGVRVREVSRLLAGLADVEPFPFVGAGLPPVGHPATLDFFFAATLQQFGFWYERNGGYGGPMVAPLGGASLKGSSYLFAAFLRRLASDEEFCSPARQAALTIEELREVFRADDGTDPMPALDLHLRQALQYGQDLRELGLSPMAMLLASRESPHPLRTLLDHLDRVGGYKEDPLRKKSSLLALILSQRPERFLVPGRGEGVAPVIDYHLMRSCLRTGLVEVSDKDLRAHLTARSVVGAREEWAIRRAAYRAIENVIAASGKRSGAVDWFFFGARQRCPETSRPECAACPLDPVCAHRVELFQPVLRTAFY
jgi:1D-myo-inositol 3-kinase